MGNSKSFKDLIVWQKAHQLVLEIYKMSLLIPETEKYGITHQIKRCAASVPANISESCGRIGLKDKIRFLYIANGSLEETKYFLILIEDLNFQETNLIIDKAEEVSKILNAYINKMKVSL
ncbi:MAG: four helix bundle protein [Bacteroidetes bacterium]|nr:MAG: four helix bundle protein [Bacteroidota bacterium]